MYKLSDIWIVNETMNNCIFNLWNKHIFLRNVWFQKLSTPPSWKGFFFRPPPPLPVWKFQSSFIHLLKFWAFENLPPLGIFNPFCWGEYGYFIEPHNVKKIFTLKNATYTLQAVAKRKPENIQTWIPTWMSLASYIVTGSWSSIG